MPRERVSALLCQGCHEGIAVVERREPLGDYYGIFWWPSPAASFPMGDVPPGVASAFEEGVRCLAVNAPNGAGAMLRSALSMIVQDKGSPEAVAKGKKELKAGVKQMVTDGTLWADFGEWADHIREMGNASVHPETHDPVSIDEAKDIRDLVRQLIEILYIQPAKIQAAKQRRASRQP